MEMRLSTSEDRTPCQGEAKCGGAISTFDTYERKGIVSKGGEAWGNSDRIHSASGWLPFVQVVNI